MESKKKKPARIHSTELTKDFFTITDKDQYEKTEKHMLLAMRIEAARKATGWSKREFANKLKVQPSVISKWLSGTHNFTSDTLFNIERELKICIVNVRENPHIELINRMQANIAAREQVPAAPFLLQSPMDVNPMIDRHSDLSRSQNNFAHLVCTAASLNRCVAADCPVA
jgi:transcriptional regulator with XRE-family HTH domain